MAVDVVLDAWAIIALLRDEAPAAKRVEAALEGGRCAMNWVNLGEVAYVLERRHGADAAARAVQDVRAKLRRTVAADADLALLAASLKVPGGISYADAFAAATAVSLDAVLWTGDPELLRSDSRWRCQDLRARRWPRQR